MENYDLLEELIDLDDLEQHIATLVIMQNHAMHSGNLDLWSELDHKHRLLCHRRNALKIQLNTRRITKDDFDFSFFTDKELKKADRAAYIKLLNAKSYTKTLEFKRKALEDKLNQKATDIATESAKLSAIREEMNARASEKEEVQS